MKNKINISFCAWWVLILMIGVFIPQEVLAQKKWKNVTGTVIDEGTGDALPGVTIRVKGKTEGTITDYNGNYSVRVSEKDVLVFSFIGMVSQEVPVGLKKIINVNLKSDLEQLEEIVVTGYGTTKAKDVTGSIKSIKLENIEDNASASVDEMLQGRLAGVRLSKAEGAPGQAMTFEIRGSNSITGNSDPLYIVDGFPIDDPTYITTIAPEDIERIDILKDASATAIYGSRGSNGVVIITTKSGSDDSITKITVNAQSGVSIIPEDRHLGVLSAYEFVKLQQELGSNAYGNAEEYRGVDGINWQEEIFEPGMFNRVNASMRAGNDLTKLFSSVGYVNEGGTLINSGFERYTGRLKVDHKISKSVDVGINTAYTHTEYTGMKVSTASVSAIKSAIMFRPVLPISEDDQEDLEEEINAGYYPPDKTLENTDRLDTRDVIQLNTFLNIKLAKQLKFRTTFGYTVDFQSQKLFYNLGTNQADRTSDGIRGSIKDSKRTKWINENTLTYNLNRKNHKLNVLAGFTLQDDRRFNTGLENTQFPFDDFGYYDMSLGNSPKIPTSGLTNTRLMSGLGRINYTYKDKYLLTASIRADGSSKFPTNNKFGYFPSFAFAWRAIEEGFIQNLDVFSNLKFKVGFGTTGNNRVGAFDHLVTYTTGNGYYFGNSNYYNGVYQGSLSNTNLKWETTQQYNAGVEMGFFKNRVIVDAEVYYKLTDDLLLDALIPLSIGFSGVKENQGSISNRGLELSLQTVNIHNKNFKWTSSFNISFNRNEVRKLSEGETERLYNPNVGGIYSEENIYGLFVGEPVGLMYGYKMDGIYQVDDFIQDPATGEIRLKEGVTDIQHTAGTLGPGLPKYADLNKDGIVNEDDRTIIGNPNPLHHGGFQNSFTYKNIDLAFLFTWSYGNDIFNGNRAVFGVSGTQRNRNLLDEVANRWTYDNPIEYGVWAVPNNTHSYLTVHAGKKMSDFWIEDGSYLRLKNIALGYSLPKRLLKNSPIESVRFSATVDNLFVLTKYSGYDPEVSVKNEALKKGIDYSAYPKGQTFTFGLNMTF
ncbi:TonB-dependent receptor [Labilibacter sediminis]|nr:TonB-dependent receptor [Labilibacter sediminis]